MENRGILSLVLLAIVAVLLWLYNTGRLGAALRAIGAAGGSDPDAPTGGAGGASGGSVAPFQVPEPPGWRNKTGGKLGTSNAGAARLTAYASIQDTYGANNRLLDLLNVGINRGIPSDDPEGTGRVGGMTYYDAKAQVTDAGYGVLASTGPVGAMVATIGKALRWRF